MGFTVTSESKLESIDLTLRNMFVTIHNRYSVDGDTVQFIAYFYTSKSSASGSKRFVDSLSFKQSFDRKLVKDIPQFIYEGLKSGFVGTVDDDDVLSLDESERKRLRTS